MVDWDDERVKKLRKRLSEVTGVPEEELARKMNETVTDEDHRQLKRYTEMLSSELGLLKKKDPLQFKQYMVVAISVLLKDNMSTEEQKAVLQQISNQLDLIDGF